MDTQLQERVTRVARRLSVVARNASKRIHATQLAILTENAERKAREKNFFKNRLSRARSGLRRLLAFAGSPSVQRIAKANERLGGKQGLLLYEDDWNVIGMNATSHVRFLIGSWGVNIEMTNSCHVRDTISAIFPYKGKEVVVQEEFGFQPRCAGTSSSEDVLCRMANGTMTIGYQTSEESVEAFRLLALWSRSAPFEKVGIAFMERLEQEVARTP